MSEDFPEIKIPFWMDGKHTRTLARASRRWWEEVGDWARFPLKQLDPMTCTDRMLDLMAWQRGVTRTVGEADRLYRLRVKHAYANAKDAGQVAGWERIFRRLELGKVAQEERQDGQDWDVIGIGIDDSAFPDADAMLNLAYELSTGSDLSDLNLIDGKYIRLPYARVTCDDVDSYMEGDTE